MNRELPLCDVIPGCAYGGGFIEGLGLDLMIVLLLLLAVIGSLEIVTGYWLRKSLRKGGKMGILLLLPYMALAIGFGVPAMLVIGPLRGILIGAGWKTLH